MIARDSSGNGNDGEYLGDRAFVSGCVAGDLACLIGYPPGATVALPLAPTQWADEWTIEAWLRSSPSLDPIAGTLYFARGPHPEFGIPDENEDIFVNLQSDLRLQDARGGTRWAVAGAVPNDDEPHHLVIVYANPHETSPGSGLLEADVTFYLDDSALTLTEEGTLTDPGSALKTEAWIGGQEASPELGAVVDEFAIYPSALSAGDVSAHYSAASTSFAVYTAAVLADSPTVYYHLNDAGQGWSVGHIGMFG